MCGVFKDVLVHGGADPGAGLDVGGSRTTSSSGKKTKKVQIPKSTIRKYIADVRDPFLITGRDF